MYICAILNHNFVSSISSMCDAWGYGVRKTQKGYAHSSRCNSNRLCHKTDDVIFGCFCYNINEKIKKELARCSFGIAIGLNRFERSEDICHIRP